jgi:cytochrome b subunit of formate dehydrogenase
MAGKQKYFERFNVFQRLEHWVMTLSFGLLALTGMPQRYALSGWAQWLMNAFGGVESTRIIHRWAAIVLGAIALVHVIELGYKLFVLRASASMIPGVKDGLDVFNVVRYNLGMTKEHPKLPRYTFAEKMEYLAVVWGTVLMGITGFMLWNPIATTQILPGQFVPAAKVAHSMEALLAVAAIVIWHLYGVHLKTFNWSMFNGKLSQHQMEAEHGGELAEIQAAKARKTVPADILRKRQMIYAPVALVIAVAGIAFLYFFATYEQTAIATVPPAETVKVVALATPTVEPTVAAHTPIPTARPVVAVKPASVPQIKHPIVGDTNCMLCHDLGDIKPMPADHNYPDSKLCLVCHRTEAAGPYPAGVMHALEGRTNCVACHVKDKIPPSHRDVGLTNEECLGCHAVDKAALAKVTVPVTQPTVVVPKPSTPAAGRATPVPQIMHALAGHENCLKCHEFGDIKPMPADHAYGDNRMCLLCHSVTGGGPLPTKMLHAVEGRTNCSTCHTKDKTPKSHQDVKITDQECLTCHEVDTAALSKTTAPVTQPTAAAPKASTPAPGQPTPVPQIKHALAGHENCLQCHDTGDIKPMPADHAYGDNRMCTVCHKADKASVAPTGLLHAIEGRVQCNLCHAVDVLPKSHKDAKLTNEECLMCHTVDKAALAKLTPAAK